jgi:hypothetical protein
VEWERGQINRGAETGMRWTGNWEEEDMCGWEDEGGIFVTGISRAVAVLDDARAAFRFLEASGGAYPTIPCD